MKKRLGILSAILVVALVFALPFCLPAAAEEANEATLTVTDGTGATSSLTGSYDEVVEALNSSISSLGEGTATIKLLSDAKATKQLVIAGTGLETVTVDLAGYTLDVSAVESAPIVVGGVKDFKLNGGHNSSAERGAIASGDAEHDVIDISSSEQLSKYEISDLVISYEASGSSAIVHNDDDELILRGVDVIWNPAADGAASKLVIADNGNLTIVNSALIDASASGESHGVVVTGTTVRMENSTVAADYCYSMNGGSWLTAADTTFEAGSAIFTATGADDIVVGAGVTFRGTILGEGATKAMINLYYGTGSTLIDTDPTEAVTVATANAALTQLESGKWTLLEKVSGESIYGIFPDRGTITEKADSAKNMLTAANKPREVRTLFTGAYLTGKTYNSTATSLINTANGSENVSIMIDFNGFDITQNRASHLFNAGGLFRLSIDGADAEGNITTFTEAGNNGSIIYVTKVDAKSVFTLKNIDIVNTNACGKKTNTLNSDGTVASSKSNSANMIQLQDCRIYMNGVSFLYTGEDYGRDLTLGVNAEGTTEITYHYTSSQSMPMIYGQGSAYITVENCSFAAAPAGKFLEMGIKSAQYALSSTADDTKIYAKNCTFDGVGTVASTTSKKAALAVVADSTVKNTTGTAFAGSGSRAITVSDCVIELPEGKALASGKVNLLNGEGNMKITTANGELPTGTHTLEDGSALYFDTVAEGYVIVSGDAVTTVKLNKLFASGMVFQAGKPINVWGTCETEGATISVTLGENTATATVVGGKWEATLPAMEYAKGLTLTVTEVGKEIGDTVFKNVDIGEVWAFAGQSNANLGAYKLEDFAEYKALADLYDNIRCFSVAANLTESPLEDASSAEWFQVDSSTVGRADSGCGISAVGYVMATRLAVELEGNPTIAIIDINYNGKAISNFISNNYDPLASSSTAEHQLYNAMIAPFEGYNIKGFGWYQGEASSDSGECDDSGDGYYGLNVDQLYATFTETFNKNEGNDPLELFIVQLSVYMGNPSYIRAYQEDIASRNEHYHVISCSYAGSTLSKGDFALDAGDGFQYGHVHAARKSPLGLAMADSILENVYFKDQNLSIANPEVESTVIEGDSIKVTLDRDFTLMFGTEVEGFELSADGINWVAASGTVDGRTITLTAEGITAPQYVRYGWHSGYIELESGEKITFSKAADGISYTADPASNKATTVTITAGGKTYVINTLDTSVLRSILNGNIIATSGHTLHVFSTALTSSSAGEN